MGLIHHYLRLFFRSTFAPIDQRRARRWTNVTSGVYFVSAWTAFGVAMYYCFNVKSEPDDSPYAGGKMYTAYDSIRKFGSEDKNTIFRIKGWNNFEVEEVTKKEAEEICKTNKRPFL
ncbi:hypothetical protein JTE90_000391 [Oedothorax gibbosus]|uniref:Uncharacterized protein n=1 Tax=Oedothorax gibbosus TaxID=931172 RepID=A0AAV6USV7_9ARAC|nr:hypothetical protein JTE90_000391 [Oedothorax gibbosus]